MKAMRSIIVASTRPYSGKTGICLALIRELEGRGRKVGYFKPYGTMPVEVDGVVTDRDAFFLNRGLSDPLPVEVVCPVVRSRSFVEDLLAGRPVPARDEVRAAYARACDGRDAIVIEGPADVEQGRAVGLSLCELTDVLSAHVLIAESVEGLQVPDAILHAHECLGERLGGVVFNRVRASDRTALLDHTVPFLEGRGVRTFGTMSHDPMLSSVTVREIAEELGGAVLCAEEHLDDLVESYMVGAMGQEKALRFFRRKSHKAVITGGDRADVQLAALETSTAALVLTGNLPPSPIVLARADELGIPMLLVDTDTLSAVERMESLMGHVRLHGPGKADRIRAMFAEGVAVEDLLDTFGL
jgi:BioD-like phosphotransacetylase family protein